MSSTPKMSPLDSVLMLLLIVGGLNWGLVGLLETDLVAEIFGDMSTLSRVVYTLVGVSAIYFVGKLAMSMGGKKSA